MVPLGLLRDRTFAAANAASMLLYFGLFGAVFLMAQFFQAAQGASPLELGLQVLPWTAVPIFSAPLGSYLAERKKGGLETPKTFVDGMNPALWIGAAVIGVGAVAALANKLRRPREGAGRRGGSGQSPVDEARAPFAVG
jgi:hypothetical protein